MAFSNRLPAGCSSTCPTCGYFMDAATAIDRNEKMPAPKDFSVCISCGALGVFDDELHCVTPSHHALKIAMRGPDGDRIRHAQIFIAGRGDLPHYKIP